MKTIFKYALPIADIQILKLPLHSRFLHVGEQHGNVCLWALVNDQEKETTSHIIRMIGTGHPIPSHLVYLGTVLTRSGVLVWHLFFEEEEN